ncbi:DEAD-box ATP-dependent RNA helicase 31-like [Mangifera indica]|uniref:DEAD-box ATP-dependent RNA helicase 31-like n=1 Tax=Mangifera indica TaxID=29780 RepID=UPI001CF96132|nr:DEAD-box ATP-dependent RNA helicase 31-like [Mangifera indica]
MPIKLLPHLRFFNLSFPVTRFPSMNLKPSIHTSGVVPTLRRAFPFKLKYLGFAAHDNDPQLQLRVRKLSTRPFRSGSGSASRPVFSRGGERRRDEIPGSKSLIEDEAELSDWVSELGRNSFRGKRINRDEEESDFRKPVRRDRDSSLMKRRRESESYGSNRRVNRNSANSFSRNNSSMFNRDLENDNGVPFSQRKNRGFERGGIDNSFTEKRSERKDRRSFKKEEKIYKRERLISDDDIGDEVNEERGRIMSGIGDLLNENVSDVDDVSDDIDDDDSTLQKNARISIGLDEEGSKTRSLPGKYDSYLSESRFDQYPLSPLSLKGIKDAGYEKMTIVQEATLPVILKGKDVLAKAKTGTGKTVAFLLPSIEVVVKSPPVSRDQKRPPILVLIVCPTRELATQAAAEANKLLKFHPSIGVQVVIGGTRLAMEQKRMQANPCQILVATPGRLRDHIENTAGFATRLMGVKVLILDEADHLLDMGFRKDIENIIAAVPKERQTLLFSATVPEEVRQICHIALKRDHEFINTVEEGSEETHSKVKQMHLVAPLDKHFPLLYVLLKEHVADNVDYKVLVFCTTAMVTRLVADLLGELKLNVREIHSRKPQSYRTRVSDEFRKSKGLILVTSDVSARGVDYPDVTLVIQVGLPADREQYIHRLGRTGRKGKEGEGLLLLAPWEEFFLSTIKDLPITKAPVPSFDPDTQKKVERALTNVEMKNKEAAYQAWLGFYNSVKNVGRDKIRLVELANEYSRSMGLVSPPAIPKRVLAKMGLRNIPGLRSE